MNQVSTKEYIESHRSRVRKWLQHFSNVLDQKGREHDQSKLEEPEYSQWCKMDEEPRYKYGTKEYNNKLNRFNYLFKMHWKDKRNRHHPEHFQVMDENEIIFNDKDLIDLVEMLCDWLGYRDSITYTAASKLVEQQCDRFGFSEELRNLLMNTLMNHFVTFGGDGPDISKSDKKRLPQEKGSLIDILV